LARCPPGWMPLRPRAAGGASGAGAPDRISERGAMARVAALPMYDLVELRAATDAWWRGLARAFRRQGVPEVPERLVRRARDARLWRDSSLLFGQVCGYPLTHDYAGALAPIATPCYRADGCAGAEYASLIVVREDDPACGLQDLRGRTAAINGPASHSGWNVLRAMAAPLATGGRFFERVVVTGSHAASLAAVGSKRADVAAIDAVTWALLARHRPFSMSGIRILDRSPRAPGLPYVTRADAPSDLAARLRDGVAEALADPALAGCRETLLIGGAEMLPLEAYGRIREIAEAGRALGDPIVRPPD
jgi:ABC transporter, phosphonate, periplasmic substrate-binding protein